MTESETDSSLEEQKVARSLYERARAYYVDGQFDKAREIYETLLKKHVASIYPPEMQMHLGGCYYWMDDETRAKELFLQALSSLDLPEEGYYAVQILYHLALIEYNNSQFDTAWRYLQETSIYYHHWQVPEAWDNRVDFGLLRGRVLLYRGQCELACSEFQSVMDNVPERYRTDSLHVIITFEIGRSLVYCNKHNEARQFLVDLDLKVVEQEIGLIEYYHVLMKLWMGLKRYELTLRTFESVTQLEVPESYRGEIYSLAGRAYYKLGKGSESLRCFRLSQQANPVEIIRQGNEAYVKELAKAGYT